MLKYLIIIMCVLASCAQTQAQSKYRCGNSFQDKPCSDGKGSVVGGATKSKSSTVQIGTEKIEIDSECKRRGSDAMKVIWKRDGGALKEDLLKEANTFEQRRSITDVYANRGNALDVRNKIEKECMTEKYKAPSFVQRNLSNEELQGEINASKKELKDLSTQNNVDKSEAIKREQCAHIGVKLMEINERQVAGASAADMDKLKLDKRKNEQQMKELKCR